MNKLQSIALLASIVFSTGAYAACPRCEEKNNNKNWVTRKSRATKCWVSRNVLRNRNHWRKEDAQVQCKRCKKTHTKCVRCGHIH